MNVLLLDMNEMVQTMFSIQYSFKERFITIFKQIHYVMFFRYNLPAHCLQKHRLNTISICTLLITTPSWCSIQYPRKNKIDIDEIYESIWYVSILKTDMNSAHQDRTKSDVRDLKKSCTTSYMYPWRHIWNPARHI